MPSIEFPSLLTTRAPICSARICPESRSAVSCGGTVFTTVPLDSQDVGYLHGWLHPCMKTRAPIVTRIVFPCCSLDRKDVQLCRRSRSQRVADCFACLNGSLFMTRKFEPSGPASRQAGTMWQKSQQLPMHRNYSGSGSSQYLPSVKTSLEPRAVHDCFWCRAN
jgi:hypothetical protein